MDDKDKKIAQKEMQILRLKLKLKQMELDHKEKENKVMRHNEDATFWMLAVAAVILTLVFVAKCF